ncbi:MAG TPA: rhomboid family intramembrane serine protease, partial [Candidatus Krumholzibacteria bacterium]|nr:rhomboid family intramembrane serine protease [Candidatus Krumholzibacteria bacterium]
GPRFFAGARVGGEASFRPMARCGPLFRGRGVELAGTGRAKDSLGRDGRPARMYFFYYIPIGIDAERRRFPTLTVLFTGICVLLFVLFRFFAASVPLDFRNYVYYPGFSPPISALAAAFFHMDYFHIASNLVYLVLFGRYLEDRVGPLRFAAIFVGSAIIGNVAQGWFNLHVLHTNAGIIGASGAISGILGAFLVRMRHQRVKIAYWVFAPLMATNRAGTSNLHVFFAIALWVLIQVVRSLVQVTGGPANVAYMTHLSGFVFGMVFVSLVGGWRAGIVEGHLVKAQRYLRKGEFYGAQDELSHYADALPHDGDAHAALARAHVQCGNAPGARESYATACLRYLAAGRRGDAERVYQEAVRAFRDFVLPPDAQLDLCFGLERSLKQDAAVLAYDAFLRFHPDHPEAAFALLRAANLHAKRGDAPRARHCYDTLVLRYPDDPWADFAREHARRLATA